MRIIVACCLALVATFALHAAADAMSVKVCLDGSGMVLCEAGNAHMPFLHHVTVTTYADGTTITTYPPGVDAWAVDHPDQFMTGDPVSATGEMVVHETDLALPGYGIDFSFERTYRSRAQSIGPLGYGWDFNYNQALIMGGCVDVGTVYLSNGALEAIRFVPDATQSTPGVTTYSADPYVPLILEHRPYDPEPWVVRDETGTRRLFDPDGRMKRIVDLAGRAVELAWVDRTWQRDGTYACDVELDGNHMPVLRYCPYSELTTKVLDSITDTTGRTIYLRWSVTNKGQWMLACLTLEDDPEVGCAGAVVRYHRGGTDARYLTGVGDALGHGDSYSYGTWVEESPDYYLADDEIEQVCDDLCGASYCWGSCAGSGPFLQELVESGQCAQIEDCAPGGAERIFTCTSASTCHQDCTAYYQNPDTEQYGQLIDLRGNLRTITNADGVRVVKNLYGEDPLDPSFDRVITQYVGPTDAPDRTITWDYSDVDSLADFTSRAICDCLDQDADGRCLEYGAARDEGPYPDPPQGVPPPYLAQRPAHQVVIHELHGVVRTRYLDERWGVLREINAGEITDYNYTIDGRPEGIELPSGQRTCRTSDALDRTLETTELPRPGALEWPRSTHLRYGADGLLAERTDDATGFPSRVRYFRGLGEVYAEEREITANVFARTSYQRPWLQRADGTWLLADEPGTIRSPWSTTTHDFCHGLPANATCNPQAQTTTINPEGVATRRYTSYDWRGQWTLRGASWTELEARTFDDAGRVSSSYRQWPGSGNESITYSYTGLPQPSMLEAPRWRRRYTYDTGGGVASLVEEARDGSAATRRRCYDRDLIDGRVLAEIAPEGALTRNTYDHAARLIAVDRGFPTVEELAAPWAQPCASNVVANTSPDRYPGEYERVATYVYDADGDLVEQVVDGLTTRFDHDGFGRVREEVRGDGSVVRRGFDSRDRIRWEAVHTAFAPAFAKPSPLLLDLSLVSMIEWKYDLLGRETRKDRWHFASRIALNGSLHANTDTVYTDDLAHTWTAREARNTVTITEGGATTTRVLDGAGRVIEERLPDLVSVIRRTWTDDRTVVEQAPNPNGVTMSTRTVHDARGLVRDVYDAQNRPLRHQDFDLDGRVVHALTGDGAEHWTTLDAFGRATGERRRVDDGGAMVTTATEWDRDDAVIAVVDGRGQRTRTLRDGLGRVVQTIDPSGRMRRSYYESGTDRAWYTTDDATGTDQMFGYDGAGRVWYAYTWDGEHLPTSGRLTVQDFGYTAHGLLSRATQWIYTQAEGWAWSQVDRAYDSHGNRTYETSTLTPDLTITHRHDGFGHLLATTAGDDTIEYINDALGRPKWTNLNGGRVVYLHYAAAGGPTQLYFGMPGWDAWPTPLETRTYDARGRLVDQAIAHTTISQNLTAPIARLTQALGRDGAPRQRYTWFAGQGAMTDVFQVDHLGRVIGESRVGGGAASTAELGNADVGAYFDCMWHEVPSGLACAWSSYPQDRMRTYWYDGADNWERRGDDWTVSDMELGPDNDLLGFAGLVATDDAGGNATLADGVGYLHDGLGRLLSVDDGTVAIVYEYDGLGRHVRESDGATTSWTVWDGDEVVADGEPDDYTLRIGAGLDTHLALYRPATGAIRYLHQGPDGSVFAVTSASGLVEGNRYTAYGETEVVDDDGVTRAASPSGNRLLYQGMLHDAERGSYWMRARSYAPRLGRFVAQDPIGLAGGLNRYSFTGGRPLTHRDPYGHEARRAEVAESRLERARFEDSVRDPEALPAFFGKFHLVDALSFPYVYTDGAAGGVDGGGDGGVPEWFSTSDPGFTGIVVAGGGADMWNAYLANERKKLAKLRELLGPRTISVGLAGSGAQPGVGSVFGGGVGVYVNLANGDAGVYATKLTGLAMGSGGPGFGWTGAITDTFENFEGLSFGHDYQAGPVGLGITFTNAGAPSGGQLYLGSPGWGTTFTGSYTWTHSLRHWFTPIPPPPQNP